MVNLSDIQKLLLVNKMHLGYKLKKSFLDIYKDVDYKETIIDTLCLGIGSQHIYSFKALLEYVINKKYQLFDREEFKGSLYSDEDETLDLVLPSIRRVFAKVFIDPPKLFINSNYGRALPENKRYKLFTMYFNVDEFIDYLIDMFIKSKECLQHFEHIDRTIETLSLIVDNYVADLVQRVLSIEDHQEAIDSILKQIKREETIEQVLDEDKNELL
jgi:hypothetical protein